ncbi:MAG: substrate-binding domain-containing protein [Paludibacteraceae bacterium]|nr:substrate-binding domain-containing protein [Paludibacteraceae bacterium]
MKRLLFDCKKNKTKGSAAFLCLCCIICVLSFCGCSERKQEKEWLIGVSQDFEDVWHNKMTDEIEQEAVLHPELKVVMKNAHGDRSLQNRQIDSLIKMGVDLLVVGVEDPLYVHAICSTAYKKGVPVIYNSHNECVEDYTAYVGTDNKAAGRLMGEYLSHCAAMLSRTADSPLRVIELLGVKGTPAVTERHEALHQYISDRDYIQIVDMAYADWSKELAYREVDSMLMIHGVVDVIVSQNDIMALGAYEAGMKHYPNRNFHILGVDALSGPGSGIESILQGKIEASITNVSRGDLIVQTACRILNEQPYARDTFLQPVLVDQSSTKLMMRMSEEMNNEMKVIKMLQVKINGLWGLTQDLQTKNYALVACSLLMGLLVILFGVLYHYRLKLHRERAENALVVARQQQQLEQMSAELTRVKNTQTRDEKLIARLQQIIEERMDDSNLSINTISTELGVSRAQLFRKVKERTGLTPVDLLRQVRLQKARQMLRQTDLSVRQVAYSVGFTSASYFARCYRAFFGVPPAEDRGK